MALYVTDKSIPAGAVRLDRHEALQYQWERLYKWPKLSQTWPFQWGVSALGFFASMTGVHINNSYRRRMKLRHHGFISALMPMFFGPAIFSSIAHTQFVTPEILLYTRKCPMCLYTRAAASQLVGSIVYPVIVGTIVNSMIALQYATYKMPYWQDIPGHVKLWLHLTKTLKTRLLPIALVQILAASALTYAEIECLYAIDKESTRENDKAEETQLSDD